jgi:hypothetical protein
MSVFVSRDAIGSAAGKTACINKVVHVWRTRRRSGKGGGELVVVIGPPDASALVALAATGPVPHRGHVWVFGVGPTPDSGFYTGDRVVHRGEQLCPTVPVKSVGVGDES